MTKQTIAVFQISTEEDLRFQLDFVGLVLTGRTLRVNVRERSTNTLKTSLTSPSGLTLAGSGNLTAFYAKASMSAWTTGEYEADVIDETGGAATRIMAVRFFYDEPGKLVYGVAGNQATVQFENNQAVVTAIGGVGPPGPANTLTIGTVDTLATGVPATASITGSSPTQVLNLGLPKGNTGTAATIAVGTTTTGAAGTSAAVTNSGTSSAAVFDFTIPRGAAATITVGTVTTGAAGSSVAVTNSGTTSAAVFNFTIPRGDTGTAATIAVGTVTTGSPGTSVIITNAGTSSAAVFNFTIPRGDQGPAGSVADGDKGDVVVSGGGTIWTIDTNVVGFAKLSQLTALSVLGNGTNATANMAAITAGTDGHVLRRSGTAVGFGTIATAGIADGAVTLAKQADIATGSIMGRSTAGTGVQEVLTPAQARSIVGVRPVIIGELIRGQFTSLPALCLWPNGQNVSRTTYALLLAATTIAGTINISNTSTAATLTLADAEAVAQVQVGMPIEGTGIQAGTTISARGTATSTTLAVTLSLAANATASANAAKVFPNGNGDGSTTFGIADYRDRASVARGNMGGTAAARLTTGNAGFNSSRLGLGGGDERLQQHNHNRGIPAAGYVLAPNSPATIYVLQGDGTSYAALTGDTGAGNSQNVQPSLVENVAIYVGV